METKRLHIYIEYADHREYKGNVRGDRRLWQVEETARALFYEAKNAGKEPHDWVIEDDDHNVLSWRGW